MSEVAIWIFLMHVAATFSMVGLIWFVQIVHYPLFARVGHTEFTAYELAHRRLTTRVVAPLMLVELITAVALVWLRPFGISDWLLWSGAILVAAIWLLTYLVQVPQHVRLAVAYDSQLQRQLVRGNWYRTAIWSARGILVLLMLGQIVSVKITA